MYYLLLKPMFVKISLSTRQFCEQEFSEENVY